MRPGPRPTWRSCPALPLPRPPSSARCSADPPRATRKANWSQRWGSTKPSEPDGRVMARLRRQLVHAKRRDEARTGVPSGSGCPTERSRFFRWPCNRLETPVRGPSNALVRRRRTVAEYPRTLLDAPVCSGLPEIVEIGVKGVLDQRKSNQRCRRDRLHDKPRNRSNDHSPTRASA
jgi:hypothetical protein